MRRTIIIIYMQMALPALHFVTYYYVVNIRHCIEHSLQLRSSFEVGPRDAWTMTKIFGVQAVGVNTPVLREAIYYLNTRCTESDIFGRKMHHTGQSA